MLLSKLNNTGLVVLGPSEMEAEFAIQTNKKLHEVTRGLYLSRPGRLSFFFQTNVPFPNHGKTTSPLSPISNARPFSHSCPSFFPSEYASHFFRRAALFREPRAPLAD